MKKLLFLALGLALVLGCEKNDKRNNSVVIDFTKENYQNGKTVKTLDSNGLTVTFGRPATWNNDDQALRIWAGTTFCLSSDKTIEKIVFSFGKEDKEAPIKAFEGEFSVNVWTGAAKKVFLEIDGANGSSRSISRMTVTLGNKESRNMTDVIDASFIGVNSTSLESWSGKKGTASPASYLGKTAVKYSDHNVIVLNKEQGGIVTNVSGGYVRHVEIKWNMTLTCPIDLLVYGDDIRYTSTSDLYNDSYAGTLLGTFTCGSSYSTIIDVEGDYKFVGLRQKPDDSLSDSWNNLYIDRIEVTWE